MIKRNNDLEKKALSMMLQNEEKNLLKYMEENGIEIPTQPPEEEDDYMTDAAMR